MANRGQTEGPSATVVSLEPWLDDVWPDPVVSFLRPVQQVLAGNPAAARLIGCQADELVGRDIPALLPGVGRDGLAAALADAEEQGVARRPWRVQRVDGTLIDAEVTIWRCRAEGSDVWAMQLRPISPGGASAAPAGPFDALDLDAGGTESIARLMARSRLAVVAVDPEGVFTFWSPFAEEYYGWRASEVLGRRPRDLVASPALEVEAENVVARMLERDRWAGRVTIYPRTGPSFEMAVTSSEIRGDDGRPIGCVMVSLPAESGETTPRMRRALIRCAACGREVAGTTRRKYCSERCRQWAYYHRHRGSVPVERAPSDRPSALSSSSAGASGRTRKAPTAE